MKTKVLEHAPLLPGVLILALALGIWSAQQYSTAPAITVPEVVVPSAPASRMAAPQLLVLEIGVLEAAKAIARGVTVIDVRSRDAYADGHIAGAISMPLDELKSRAPELAAAKDKEYIVYCGNGSTLGPEAARAMAAAGHPSTRNLPAGYSGWKAAGQAVATGAR